MAETKTQHGAIAFITRNGIRVALARDPEISLESPLAPVEPNGQPHPEEYLITGSEVGLSFTLYRRENQSVTQQGFFPSMADARAFVNHPEQRIEIENLNGVTLHRIVGFKAESVRVGYTKGEPSMYQIDGRGIKHFDEADI